MTAARRRTTRLTGRALTGLGTLTLLSSVLLVAQPASASDAASRMGAAPTTILVTAEAPAELAPQAETYGQPAVSSPSPTPTTAATTAPATTAPATAEVAAAAPPETPPGQDADGPAPLPVQVDEDLPDVVPGLALPVRPCDPLFDDCRGGADQGAPALPVPAPGPAGPRPCDPEVSECRGGRPVLTVPTVPTVPNAPSRPTGAGGPTADDGGPGSDGPTTGGTGEVVGARVNPGSGTSSDNRPGDRARCDEAGLTCSVSGSGSGSGSGSVSGAVDRARSVVAGGVNALARTGSPVLVLFLAGLALVLFGGVLAGWAPRRPRHRLVRA